jgi:hypothetical protein
MKNYHTQNWIKWLQLKKIKQDSFNAKNIDGNEHKNKSQLLQGISGKYQDLKKWT